MPEHIQLIISKLNLGGLLGYSLDGNPYSRNKIPLSEVALSFIVGYHILYGRFGTPMWEIRDAYFRISSMVWSSSVENQVFRKH